MDGSLDTTGTVIEVYYLTLSPTAWAKAHPMRLSTFLALFSDLEKNLNQHNYLVIIQRL